MGHSLSELIRRGQLKISSLDKETLRLRKVISDSQASLLLRSQERNEVASEIYDLNLRLEARVADGLKRSRGPIDKLSSDLCTRLRQSLNRTCDEAEIAKPDWIKTISDSDIDLMKFEDLLERYVLSDNGIAPHLDAEERSELSKKVAELLSGVKRPSVNSETLYATAPGWTPEVSR